QQHAILEARSTWWRGPAADLLGDNSNRVSGDELSRRMAANAGMLAAARPHIDGLAALLARVPHVVYLTDRDGIVLHAAGSTPHAAAVAASLPGLDRSRRTATPSAAGIVLTTGRPAATLAPEGFLDHSHGSVYQAAPVRDAHGALAGVIELAASVPDSSPDRLMLIAALADSIRRELEHQEVVRSAESLRASAGVAAFMAHEMLGPLSILHAGLAVLAGEDLGDRPRQLVERCKRQAETMKQSVEDIRALAATARPALAPVPLAELLEELLDSLGPANRRRLAADVVGPGRPDVVPSHRGLLRIALRNLLRNALEAVPETGAVGIRTDTHGAQVRITVWDEGPGIPAERRASLFEESFTTKEGGSGIGLVLVKTVVEDALDGSVSFEPNQPCGCRFHIDLPGPSNPGR
ncbi:MAG: hypothetical protein HY321_05590, partial [Armatimonadetes bacterium]|nr:hypothetical protein [Armatimonadota bacterium]